MKVGEIELVLKDLRGYIRILEDEGFLKRLSKPLSKKYEVSSVLKEYDGKKAVFASVKGFEMNVVGNLCCRKDFIAKGLDIEPNQLIHQFIHASQFPIEPKVFNKGPSQEVENENVDLNKELPILTHYEHDRGPYITSSIIIAKDPETHRTNASYHRMLLTGKKRLAARLVEGRNLHSFYQKSKILKKPLEAAVIIGAPLELLLAAAMSYGDVSELTLAGGLMKNPLELVKCKTINIEVPRRAEIVLEGHLLLEKEKEGPFVDITGSYDVVREQPIFEVEMLTRQEDAFYQALLSGGLEHQLLMGTPKEAQIYDEVKNVSAVKELSLTQAGSNWLDVVISIKKRHQQEPYLTALAAIAAHYSLKRVVIVDEDVDVNNLLMVEKAILERAHPVEDFFVLKNIKGSTLDKSGIRSDNIVLPPAKIVIDATIKDQRELFERGKIP